MGERLRNHQWTVSKSAGGGYAFEAAQLTVLMDIRDELIRLNQLLHCPNFVEIPSILRGVRRNTTKPKRKKKAAPK